MSKIDLVLTLSVALGMFFGYKKGFLMELFFLCAIVLGVFVGFKLMGAGVGYLHDQFNSDTVFLPYISFALIFILVVILVTFFGNRIKSSVDATFLGKVDSLAGGILGGLKFMFCASVIFWLMNSFHYRLPDGWTRDSWLYPATVRMAPAIASFFSGILPVFKGIFRQF